MSTLAQPSVISQLMASGVLDRALVALEARYRETPRDLALLRRLGTTYRQKGALDLAAKIFAEVASLDPSDAQAIYLRDLLQGRPGARGENWPVNFLLSRDYLPPAEYRNLLAELTPLALAMTSHRMHGRIPRWDFSGELGLVQKWFAEHIRRHFTAWCDVLRVPAFVPEIRGISFTRYANGESYPLHNDGQSEKGNLLEVVYFVDFAESAFEGGELVLLDAALFGQRLPAWTAIPPVGNTLVVFPSAHWHEIAGVRCDSRSALAGRFMLAAYCRAVA